MARRRSNPGDPTAPGARRPPGRAPRPRRPPRGPDGPAPKRRSTFGGGTLLYIGVTLLIALGAFNSQNNLLFWTFGFALAVLVVSGAMSGAMLMGVRVEREAVEPAAVGEPLRLRYRLRNRNRLLPALALTVEEVGLMTPEKPSRLERWLRLAPPEGPEPPIGRPMAFVVHVGPGQTVTAEAAAPTLRRGAVALTGVVVHTSFPFGLVRKRIAFAQPGALVVTPARAPVDPAVLASGRVAGRGGETSRRAGVGDEFFALREFRHGDPLRDVAWRASARRGALVVRQYAAPSPRRVWIALSLRTRPNHTLLDERAISMAATLCERAERLGMEYGLVAPLTRLLVAPRRGPAHLARCLVELGRLDLGPDDGSGARAVMPSVVADRGAAGAACVIVHAGPIDPGVVHGAGAGGAGGGRGGRLVHVTAVDAAGTGVLEEGAAAPAGAGDRRAAAPAGGRPA